MKARPKKQPPAQLTDSEADVLVFLDDCMSDDALCRAPTLKAIGARFGFSKQCAFGYLERLKTKLCIVGQEEAAYTLRLTPLGEFTARKWRTRVDRKLKSG